MNRVRKNYLFLLNTIFLLFSTLEGSNMDNTSLKAIKAFVYSNINTPYKMKVKINEQLISDWEEDFSNIKILNQEHPLRFSNIPEFIKKDLFFILKRGPNSIEIEYKKTHQNNSDSYFRFALASNKYGVPFFYFSTLKSKGKLKSTFNVYEEEPKDYKMTIEGDYPAFVYHAKPISFFQVALNDKKLMAFGNARGITDLPLIEGENKIEIHYETENNDQANYFIYTPTFSKNISQKSKENDIDKKNIATHIILKK